MDLRAFDEYVDSNRSLPIMMQSISSSFFPDTDTDMEIINIGNGNTSQHDKHQHDKRYNHHDKQAHHHHHHQSSFNMTFNASNIHDKEKNVHKDDHYVNASSNVQKISTTTPNDILSDHDIKDTTYGNIELTFPLTRTVLWDRRPIAPGLLVRPHDILPHVALPISLLQNIYTHDKDIRVYNMHGEVTSRFDKQCINLHHNITTNKDVSHKEYSTWKIPVKHVACSGKVNVDFQMSLVRNIILKFPYSFIIFINIHRKNIELGLLNIKSIHKNKHGRVH